MGLNLDASVYDELVLDQHINTKMQEWFKCVYCKQTVSGRGWGPGAGPIFQDKRVSELEFEEGFVEGF